MSILKKVSSIIPGKGDDKEYYLALLITYRGVETAAFYLDENRVKSQTFGSASFVGAGNILETAAEAIDQACEPLNTDVKEVILGLPDSWISNNQILPQYFDKLKELAKNLDIVPFAFVSHNHAIVNRLKIKFGTTICGFLLHIDEENLTLSSIKSGHLVQTRFLRSEGSDMLAGVQKLFAHFTLSNQDCEYVYVAGQNIPPNLDEAIQGLPLFSIQKPKITRLDANFPVRSIALAGAVDRGNLLGLVVEDEDSDETTNAQVGVTEDVQPKPVEPPAPAPDDVKHASVPLPAEPEKSQEADNATEPVDQAMPVPTVPAAPAPLPDGFVAGQDIATAKESKVSGSEERQETPNEPVQPPVETKPPEQHAFAVAVPQSDNLVVPQHEVAPASTSAPAPPVIHSGPPPTPQDHANVSTVTHAVPTQPHRRLPLPSLSMLPTMLFGNVNKVIGLFSGVTGRLGKLAFLLITPLILIVLAAGAFFFVAKARVEVSFLPRTLENTLAVTVNPKLTSMDEATRQIPGTSLSTDVAGELRGTATGKKKVGEKAQGSITIFNKTAQSRNFPQNTVITSNNLSFVLAESITVPQRTATESADREIVIKPGKATVNVAASDIGPDYNVATGTDFVIRGVTQESFDAEANSAFSGGSARDVTVIADEDIKRTETQLTTQLKEQAKSALLAKVTENQKVIDDSITVAISKRTTSKQVGDEASDFTMEANATAQATVYANDALKTLVDAAVKAQVPDGYNLSETGTTGEATVRRAEKDGNVLVDWHYRAALVPEIDEEQLKKEIAGKSFDFATKRMQGIPNVSQVVIALEPQPFTTIKRLPFQSSKITLTANTAQ